MDYFAVSVLHKRDPALAALRKEWLPLAVVFLYETFKRKHEYTLPQEQFRERLDSHMERINQMLSDDEQLTYDPDSLIDTWSRESDLIRVRNREDAYIVQLTPHADRLLGWFDDLQNQGMIGTESRLRTLIGQIDEVVTRSTEDVEARLRELYDRRDQIDEEIAHIEATQCVETYSDVQIRERLEQITQMANALLRDFTRVEERFRQMARDIQQAQLDPTNRRGDILNSALDAEEQLRESDEGQSFQAFYAMLTTYEERERFDQLLSKLFSMSRLREHAEGNAVLRDLTKHLLESGENVNRSNQHLAEHLRRVVDTSNVAESRRVQTLAQEIKHQVSRLEGDAENWLTSYQPFFEIDGDPEVYLPLERPLFEPPETFETVEKPRAASGKLDMDAIATLYEAFFIDREHLRENIDRLLMSRESATLAELLTSYPVTRGIAEIIAYIVLAAEHPAHKINRHRSEEVPIKAESDHPDDDPAYYQVPLVIFRRDPEPTLENGAQS